MKVTKSIQIKKERILPLSGTVLVKEGDRVSFDTIVAQAFTPGEPEIINAAPKLNVLKPRLNDYMLKQVGDKIVKGEIIAQNIYLFGLMKKFVYAPFDGSLENISKYSGRVIVRGAPIPIDVKAYVPGIVVEVIPDQGVVIETTASFIQGIFGIGGESFGEIHMITETVDEPITGEMITSEHAGKILVGGSIVTAEAMKKANELGVVGIVTGGISSKDLTEFLGYEIGVAITGEEEINITLIATESFGEMPMAQHTFDMMKELEGQMASINGSTQIRAGVVRPEIMVPHLEEVEAVLSEENIDAGMTSGTRVRVIRAPYFGKLGNVASLPTGLQQLETESKARVMEVEFDDGARAIVPRANVELIVE
ncbi:hypothetical protein MCGE09_00114 [Thaumarchaeota archaeon SCGC AB-539-E09]|nr:hypothetical protein MCGE09_00114 [Thaumarchaeota archaeon SCGC AB-539-E09]